MKHHVVKAYKTASSVKLWQLWVMLAVFMMLSALGLRQNNLKMGELREAVLVADSKNQNVPGALDDLRFHIYSHMNTKMSQPLNLVDGYNRAFEKARKKAEETGANPEVYKKAQQICEDPNVVLSVRAQCIQDYVTANAPQGQNPGGIEIPPKELFIYDFQPPLWSPDVAGWSMAISVFILAIIVCKLIKTKLYSQLLAK